MVQQGEGLGVRGIGVGGGWGQGRRVLGVRIMEPSGNVHLVPVQLPINRPLNNLPNLPLQLPHSPPHIPDLHRPITKIPHSIPLPLNPLQLPHKPTEIPQSLRQPHNFLKLLKQPPTERLNPCFYAFDCWEAVEQLGHFLVDLLQRGGWLGEAGGGEGEGAAAGAA